MAGSFNKVILMGNLTRDPELRYTPQGTAVTDIGLAINDNRSKSEQQKTTFVDVTFWERSAEIICEYMHKGSSILVEGRLQTDSWDDRDTGKKVYKLKVIAQSFQFTGGRADGDNNQGGGGAQRSTGNFGGGSKSQNNQGQYGGGSRPARNSAPSGGGGQYNDFDSGDFGGGAPDDDIPF